MKQDKYIKSIMMLKFFLVVLLNIKILPEILPADFHRDGSNDSIQPIEHMEQIKNVTISKVPKDVAGCVLSIGGVVLKFKPHENNSCILKPGITPDTEIQNNPAIPCGLNRNVISHSDPWTEQIFKSIGAELMDRPKPEALILQPAANGIVMQAVVFQRTFLWPNLHQLPKTAVTSETSPESITVYKWSEIKNLVREYCSLERITTPLILTGTELNNAFKTGTINLEFTPNYPTNTGFTVPVYWHQIFEAPFDLCGNPNPIYKIYVDEPDFHAFKVDKSAVYPEPEGHNIYPWKLQVMQE